MNIAETVPDQEVGSRPKKPRRPREQLSQRLVFSSTLVQVDDGSVIKLRCYKCFQMKVFQEFGTRVMQDGVIRNQPRCSGCRSRKSKD